MRRLLHGADRFVSRYGPWLCYAGLAVIGALGFFQSAADRRAACERFRQDDLPVFVREWGTNFGEELLGDQQPDGTYAMTPEDTARVDSFNDRNLSDLRRILPASEC